MPFLSESANHRHPSHPRAGLPPRAGRINLDQRSSCSCLKRKGKVEDIRGLRYEMQIYKLSEVKGVFVFTHSFIH